VGDEVRFEVVERGDRPVAVGVKLLPQGSVVLESVSDTPVLGASSRLFTILFALLVLRVKTSISLTCTVLCTRGPPPPPTHTHTHQHRHGFPGTVQRAIRRGGRDDGRGGAPPPAGIVAYAAEVGASGDIAGNSEAGGEEAGEEGSGGKMIKATFCEADVRPSPPFFSNILFSFLSCVLPIVVSSPRFQFHSRLLLLTEHACQAHRLSQPLPLCARVQALCCSATMFNTECTPPVVLAPFLQR
jgi:hypothetical protein